MPQSAAFLRALRRRHGLGEFKRASKGASTRRPKRKVQRVTVSSRTSQRERFPGAGIDPEAIRVYQQDRFGVRYDATG